MDKIKQKKPVNKKKCKISEFQEFIRFLALPEVFREKEFGFSKKGDFAIKYKVNPSTLSGWQDKEGFWEDVGKLRIKWGRDKTPDVLLGLFKKAKKDGNAAEAKLWYQLVEGWNEKTETEHSGELKVKWQK